MKGNTTLEVITSVVLVGLAVLLLNPFHFWMPNMVLVVLLALTLVAFALLAAFVLREQARDERDAAHRMFSGRIAFLTGSTLLVVGIALQAVRHAVDAWLVVTLVAMVLSKLLTRIYSDARM